ncbi:3-deoxy-D-manno-octulosonic acid transferase [Granulicella arctica]|uniref:3-deoxy-D-manno-octulosonic acid transferase n=1 Tax=Granulicella arctica TaxID=940613 RepID=UPI0021DFE34E|nr:glycosyltransferase N-terminal domain-containing protein [Granulicella arctica]
MLVYSSLLLLVLVVGSPYWLVRMATSGRYRKGLAGRLGRIPAGLWRVVAGKDVVWVHAVSVGEVLAASRLVTELEAALGPGWVVVVSTTTATGQALAQERFGAERVFFYPLDLGWAVRAYLRVLRPKLLVLMESELWPGMLAACGRAGVPVAVVNARMSDRSFARAMRVRVVWDKVLRHVTLFLTQSEEDARRLVAVGARAEAVKVAGNLKFDVRAPKESRVAGLIREAAAGRRIVVAGSTVGDKAAHWGLGEESDAIHAWEATCRSLGVLLVVAPRHPERFDLIYSVAMEFPTLRATEMLAGKGKDDGYSVLLTSVKRAQVEIIILDTIGDLAAVYGVADVAFVGGSLAGRGGHNPLEPAQFGVPVVMGPSYENFRGIVEAMREADAIRIVAAEGLGAELVGLLSDPVAAKALGERGRQVFLSKAGATERIVAELMGLMR